MQLLNNEIVNTLLTRFPRNIIKNLNIYNTKSNNNLLFNENNIYYILKPKGKKSYLWFTYYEKKTMCILILVNNNNITDKSNMFYDLNINFDNTLCYNNVLLYGYYFKKKIEISNSKNKPYIKNRNFKTDSNYINYFIIENIFNYNIYNSIITRSDYNNNYDYKLSLFNKIMPLISNTSDFNISIPIILKSNEEIFKIIYNLDYEVYNISIYNNQKYLGNHILNNNTNKIYGTFKIKATVYEDIYNLYINEHNNLVYYDNCLIDSYKTSKFMNSLFRNIKENIDLDKLEESDDEDEFENINIDKFVNLEKSINIECIYNNKFRKWIPQKISNLDIINKKNLLFSIKNKNLK